MSGTLLNLSYLCGQEDSNFHGSNSHQPLKLARLPFRHDRKTNYFIILLKWFSVNVCLLIFLYITHITYITYCLYYLYNIRIYDLLKYTITISKYFYVAIYLIYWEGKQLAKRHPSNPFFLRISLM